MLNNSGERLSISTGSIVRFFLVIIIIAALYYLRDVLLVVVSAVVIASALEPVVRRMGRYHIHRVVAAVLIYLVLAGILAGVFIFFMPLLVNDSISFLASVPRQISLDDIWSPIRDFGINVGPAASSAVTTVSLADLVSSLQSAITGTTAGAFKTASFLFGGVLSFLLIIVLSFYLVVQEDGVENFLRIVTPAHRHEYVINLWGRARRKIGSWLQGQVLLGVLIGVLVYLVLMVVGVPHALVLAVLAGSFELIPIFGPIISSVPAILVTYSELGTGTAILLIGLYLIIYQFESQLFYPLVVKKIVGISPIIVILALVIGAKLAGVLGAIIAVPLSAALMEYVYDVEKRKKGEHESMVNKLQ
ncbi:MAG TPA: AI-2E family transporter [Candidatus Paceibacterota bacterium]|jgi:predicted PurR-regulated permease PerM|nr:AI-2E family transporter [Candidatus Paceibacterota bacterium]